MSAVAASTGAMPAIPAMAATINVPGIGDFDVPVPQEWEQPVQQLNQQVRQAMTAMPAPAPAALAPAAPQAAPQLPGFQAPSLQGMFSNSPGEIALDAARSKVGAQYSWGAAGPSLFDCSGLVKWSFAQAGVELPRTSFMMSHVGAPVAYENMKPGDIVVTSDGGHVGLYAGGGQMLNAVQSGTPVSYTALSPDMVVTARRIV